MKGKIKAPAATSSIIPLNILLVIGYRLLKITEPNKVQMFSIDATTANNFPVKLPFVRNYQS